MQLLILIISYCYMFFTIDLFIVEYFDYQIVANNTVNQCLLFCSVKIMEIFMSKSFRVMYYFASSSALKVIDVKFVRLSDMMQNKCKKSYSSENRNHI